MTDPENQLLKQFMQEQKQNLPDEGFSRKVMRKLPGKAWRLSALWSIFCWSVSGILFFRYKGWELLCRFFYETGYSILQNTILPIDQLSLILATATVAVIGIKKICSLK